MEQDERAVLDLSEGNTQQGGHDPAPSLTPAEILDGAEEGVSEAHKSVHGVALAIAKKQNLEVIGDVLLGASSPSALATGMLEEGSEVADGDQDTAMGDGKKQKRACSVTAAGSTVPKRFVAASPAGDPPAPAASPLPSASASGLRTAIFGVTDASTSSSSNSPPSRGRKQRRPEQFIPEEAESTGNTKARRSDIFLDRILSSLAHGCSASDSEWVRNVTAEDATVRGEHEPSVEVFRIRDASRQAARARGLGAALSRLGRASSLSSAAAGCPPGEPDGRGRFYGVLAVLGASLALSVVSCVLFYVVGQRSDLSDS